MAADEANQKATRKTNDVGPTGQAVAANIARIRAMRVMSTYRLSELLEELGRPIAPSAITRIESGARKVDVDDLIAIAVALRVSPTGLLLPPNAEPTNTVDITAAGDYTNDVAWDWLLGIAPLELPEDDDGEQWNDFQTYSRPSGRRQYRGNAAWMTQGSGKTSSYLDGRPRESDDYRQRGATPTDRPFGDRPE